MATGKKTGGRNFQKGVVTNPKGRPRIPFDIVIAREAAQKEFLQMTLEIGELTRPEANAFIKDDKRTLNELMIASVAIKAAKGDMQAVEFLTTRKIGKVPNPVADVNMHIAPLRLAYKIEDLDDGQDDES